MTHKHRWQLEKMEEWVVSCSTRTPKLFLFVCECGAWKYVKAKIEE